MRKIIFILLFILVAGTNTTCSNQNNHEKYYNKYHVTGSFLFYDLKKDAFIRFNPARTRQGFLPASTFKIVNSLIALEEKIIPDEKHIFKWDGTKREYEIWNKDHDLASAFKNSVVWYYQKLARKIGKQRMKEYLKQMHYGNQNLSGPIDKFWLQGDFRVSQEQQINLLLKLYKEELPVSKRTMDIVKSIMLYEKSAAYTIYAKTGMTMQGDKAIGWWIGFIIKGDNVYFFANNIEKVNPESSFAEARIQSANEILSDLNIL